MKTLKRVAVIDDDPVVVRFLEKRLKETGQYDVLSALSGNDGLTLIRTFKPHVILLDVMIPDRSGGDVAETLQIDPDLCHIPVVFMTVLLDEKEPGRKQFEVLGRMYRAVAKPIHMPQLLSTMRKALNEADQHF